MANFSVNQVRHLYVVGGSGECKTTVDGSTITQGNFANVGDIQVKKAENEMYFLYNGPSGVVKSDFININNITSIKAIDAAKNVTKLRKVKVTLNGSPVSGEDYVLKINFKNFFSSGDESQYFKDVAVHATSSMEASSSDFYKAMVSALNKAFSREDGATPTSNPYLKFKIGYSTSGESEEGDANWSNTANKIIIEEKEQSWELGTKKARRIMFDVFCGTILDDDVWGTVADLTPGQTIGNGKNIADLEWFCMGERGDQYRNVGWPNVVPTKYVADATKQYHLLEIHYAFTDTGVNSYRTEKEMTIAVEKGASTANYTKINLLIAAVNAVAGDTLVAAFV